MASNGDELALRLSFSMELHQELISNIMQSFSLDAIPIKKSSAQGALFIT